MQQKEILEKPPVFIDIGASGEIHNSWKKLAKYSICIGLDADIRETEFFESENKGYKKLYIVNKIVSEKTEKTDFYLTSYPFCSGRLKPNEKELSKWAFAKLFEVEEKISLQSTTINDILKEMNINYIDWFKTDSQGTDLRIFESINSEISDNIIVAEFEPGIINAYKGEDLLYSIMKYMNNKNFWMSDMLVRGSQRIEQGNFKKEFNKFQNKIFRFANLLKSSPGWVEVSYFNTYESDNLINKRDLLLSCAIAITKKQYGFAIDLAKKAQLKYDDIIFKEILNFSIKKIHKNIFYVYSKKILQKLLTYFE